MFPKSNVSKDNFNKKKATIFLLKYKIYYKSKILALFDELSFFNCIQRVEWIFWPKILLFRTQTACSYTKSKYSLNWDHIVRLEFCKPTPKSSDWLDCIMDMTASEARNINYLWNHHFSLPKTKYVPVVFPYD